MDEVQVEVVCAEGGQGLVEAFGDAVVVGVPAARSEVARDKDVDEER